MRFVDANIFVRFFVRDSEDLWERCLRLFDSLAAGVGSATTSEAVVAEVVFVLTSRRLYGLGRAEAARLLRPLLEIRALRLDRKEVVLAALMRFGSSALDFVDCLAVEHVLARNLEGIYSLDRDYDRIPGVTRFEP
jgi:predicted nucleic acid-binding protein